jgi:hypothetical protein
MARLLTETMTTSVFALTEDKTTGKVTARGEFGRVDVPTQNGRRYPRPIYEREVGKLQEDLDKRRVLMELDHPADGKTSLQRVAALMTELKIERDGRVVGAAEILDTPNGRTLKSLMQHGVGIGVSSRGFGSTKPCAEGEGDEVCEDFTLKTFDFVSDPAMKSAYPDVMFEDVNTAPFDLEGLRAQMPEAFAALEESLRADLVDRALDGARAKLAAASATMVAEAVAAAREEERERFERGLIGALQGVHAQVAAEVRAELQEQAAAQVPEDSAAAVLGHVAALLRPYLPEAPADHVAEALAAADAQLAALTEQAGTYRALAQEAGLQLLAERLVADAPQARLARQLVADAGTLADADAVRARAGAVLEHLATLPTPPDAGAAAARQAAADRKALRAEIEALHGQVAEQTVQLRKAVELSEALDARARGAEQQAAALQEQLTQAKKAGRLAAYKAEAVSGLVNGRELLSLLEGVDDAATVDRLVEQRGRRTMGDGDLERMRASLTRGHLAPATLEEASAEGHRQRSTAPDDLGFDMADVQQLAGLR